MRDGKIIYLDGYNNVLNCIKMGEQHKSIDITIEDVIFKNAKIKKKLTNLAVDV